MAKQNKKEPVKPLQVKFSLVKDGQIFDSGDGFFKDKEAIIEMFKRVYPHKVPFEIVCIGDLNETLEVKER